MRTFYKTLAIILLVLVTISVPAFAQGNYPSPTREFFVNDFANVLSQSTENKIADIGKQLENKTGAQVVVVTISSLDGQDIDSYSNELFTKWGIGQKGKDNGILILDAVQERKLRIEVGYGLEGAVPDIKTADIREKYMNPYLKGGDYDNGLLNGYVTVVQEVAKEYNASIDTDVRPVPQHSGSSRSSGRNVPFIFPIFVIIFLAVDLFLFRFRITSTILKIVFWSNFFRGGRGGGGWGGGSWGGGGSGGGSWGGGGSSGGGGQSGGGGSSGGY